MRKVSKYPTEHEVEARRLAAKPYIESGTPHKEIAARFGVSKRTVRQWRTRLFREGEAGLRVMRPFHRPSKLSDSQKQNLVEILLAGAEASGFDTEIWTSERVAEVIEGQFSVHYNPKYLPRLLHALGFSSQLPQRQAAERDEARIRTWVRTVWPAVKKKPAEREQK